MTISSKKGTGKDIEVFDYFDDNIVDSQMKQVIQLDRIYIWDNNGSYVENIQFEQYENCGFVTTLPKLEAGQKYTITCVALVNKQLLSTSATTKLKTFSMQEAAKMIIVHMQKQNIAEML